MAPTAAGPWPRAKPLTDALLYPVPGPDQNHSGRTQFLAIQAPPRWLREAQLASQWELEWTGPTGRRRRERQTSLIRSLAQVRRLAARVCDRSEACRRALALRVFPCLLARVTLRPRADAPVESSHLSRPLFKIRPKRTRGPGLYAWALVLEPEIGLCDRRDALPSRGREAKALVFEGIGTGLALAERFVPVGDDLVTYATQLS